MTRSSSSKPTPSSSVGLSTRLAHQLAGLLSSGPLPPHQPALAPASAAARWWVVPTCHPFRRATPEPNLSSSPCHSRIYLRGLAHTPRPTPSPIKPAASKAPSPNPKPRTQASAPPLHAHNPSSRPPLSISYAAAFLSTRSSPGASRRGKEATREDPVHSHAFFRVHELAGVAVSPLSHTSPSPHNRDP